MNDEFNINYRYTVRYALLLFYFIVNVYGEKWKQMAEYVVHVSSRPEHMRHL